MTHPNDMTAWPAIACQRHHDEHHTRLVQPTATHAYHDLPQLPEHLRPTFSMYVWDPSRHPVDGGRYCPAHDAVSATIITHGQWEPVETLLLAHTFTRYEPDSTVFLDIGCQLGWFSLVALQFGLTVVAVDAEGDNLELLRRSADENGWRANIALARHRIGPGDSVVGSFAGRVVKIDVEGAEPEVIAALAEPFDAEAIDHVLVEISPVFHDRYPAMVRSILDRGFNAYRVPGKAMPPIDMRDVASVMADFDITDTIVDDIPGWHQENVWFKRHGVQW